MSSYPPFYPHDPIEEIFPDIYMVRGQIPLNPILTITRNMAIIRSGDDLTLINAMRLDAAGEANLRSLGNVKTLLRLGPFHGVDDRYYVENFGAELWIPGPSESHPQPAADLTYTESTELPFPNARIIAFTGTKENEAMVLLEREGGILLTCDGIQNYGDYRHNNFLARLLLPWIGFPKTTIVGPFWLKLLTENREKLHADFERLLESRFEHLLAAHGSLLRGGAHERVRAAVDKAFK